MPGPRAVQTFIRYLQTTRGRWGGEGVTPKLPKHLLRPLTDRELEALLGVCAADPQYGERDAAMILVMLDTGIRVNETSSDIPVAPDVLEKLNPQQREELVALVRATREWFAGPLPPLRLMSQYKEIDPGFPERIMQHTELEAEERHRREWRLVVSEATT